MNRGIFSWKSFAKFGLLLVFIGVFFPQLVPMGLFGRVWTVRAGLALLVFGLGAGLFYAATGRLRPSGSRSGRVVHSAFGGGSMSAHYDGPSVNVDGAPMIQGGSFDVMGKAYGDSGASSGSDIGSGMSGSGTHSSGMGGSDW